MLVELFLIMVANGFCVSNLLAIRAVLASLSLVLVAERSALQEALTNPLQRIIILKARDLSCSMLCLFHLVQRPRSDDQAVHWIREAFGHI